MSSGGKEQASLTGGHVQYVKGVAEVSLGEIIPVVQDICDNVSTASLQITTQIIEATFASCRKQSAA